MGIEGRLAQPVAEEGTGRAQKRGEGSLRRRPHEGADEVGGSHAPPPSAKCTRALARAFFCNSEVGFLGIEAQRARPVDDEQAEMHRGSDVTRTCGCHGAPAQLLSGHPR